MRPAEKVQVECIGPYLTLHMPSTLKTASGHGFGGHRPLLQGPADEMAGPATERWVANGTRTRNSQNHNLELYH